MIFPEDTDLGEIAQTDSFSINFYIDGLSVDESIESVDITTNEPLSSVLIDTNLSGGTISGDYGEQFEPEANSLTYVNSDGELISVDDWDELPDRSEAELTSWEAPDEIVKTFTYTVIFNITGTSGSRQEIKDYEHTVYGDYSAWGDQLRAYVGNS